MPFMFKKICFSFKTDQTNTYLWLRKAKIFGFMWMHFSFFFTTRCKWCANKKRKKCQNPTENSSIYQHNHHTEAHSAFYSAFIVVHKPKIFLSLHCQFSFKTHALCQPMPTQTHTIRSNTTRGGEKTTFSVYVSMEYKSCTVLCVCDACSNGKRERNVWHCWIHLWQIKGNCCAHNKQLVEFSCLFTLFGCEKTQQFDNVIAVTIIVHPTYFTHKRTERSIVLPSIKYGKNAFKRNRMYGTSVRYSAKYLRIYF